MESMQKADEQRIVSALETAIKTANEGATPDDAITKVAQDAQFGPEMVKRMVEAFNVSKTLGHLKNAAEDTRAASFPIANIENILGAIWPAEPETPAKAASQQLHSDYFLDEVFKLPVLSKEAAAKLPRMVDRAPDAYEADPTEAVTKAIHDQEKLARLRKDIENTSNEVFMQMWSCLDKAAAYYSQVGPKLDFETFEKRAYSAYGAQSRGFMDALYKAAHLGDHRLQVKRASADDLSAQQQMYFNADEEPYSYMADSVNLARALVDLRKQASVAREVEHFHAISNADRLPPQPVVAAIASVLSKQAASDCDTDAKKKEKAKKVYKHLRAKSAGDYGKKKKKKHKKPEPKKHDAMYEEKAAGIRSLAEITHGIKPESQEKAAAADNDAPLGDLFGG